jgi:hypothetical protein
VDEAPDGVIRIIMPTTLSPKTFQFDDARTDKLLRAIAEQLRNLLIDEGGFEDNF